MSTSSLAEAEIKTLLPQIRAGFNSNTLGSNRAPVQAQMDRDEPLLGRDSLTAHQ